MSQTKKTKINNETDLDRKIEIYLVGYNKESVKTKIKDLGFNLKEPSSLSVFNDNFDKELNVNNLIYPSSDMIKSILEEI